MNKSKKITISVGIPVHNEASTIQELLQSIIRQKSDRYILEKIFVLCDGTTDGTDEKVKVLQNRYPMITLVIDGKRKGKLKRLEQLYALNTSDLVVTFDGDVVLGNEVVLDELVKKFTKKSVVIVGGNAKQIRDASWISYCIYVWNHLWYLTRRDVNHGNNVHNIRGCIIALRKSLSKIVHYPKNSASESQYLFFFAITKKLSFIYADRAFVYYAIPNNSRDYIMQKIRPLHQKEILLKEFGNWIFPYYEIPAYYKFKALLSIAITHPIGIFMAYIFQYYIAKKAKKYTPDIRKGIWGSVGSTKKALVI